MKELYFSVDVETNGPIPGDFSILSLGTVAFTEEGEDMGAFSYNLIPLPWAKQDANTMEFWDKNPEAWKRATENQFDPEEVIQFYVGWVKNVCARQGARAVFVGYPAGFDFTFVYWYCHHFAKECPFGFQALDIKSYAMAILGTDFKSTIKKTMPKDWFPENKHTHIAVEDAREQGLLFLNMLRASRERS